MALTQANCTQILSMPSGHSACSMPAGARAKRVRRVRRDATSRPGRGHPLSTTREILGRIRRSVARRRHDRAHGTGCCATEQPRAKRVIAESFDPTELRGSHVAVLRFAPTADVADGTAHRCIRRSIPHANVYGSCSCHPLGDPARAVRPCSLQRDHLRNAVDEHLGPWRAGDGAHTMLTKSHPVITVITVI